MASEWRSVIAVSQNLGGNVRLIKRPKLYMSTTNTTRTDFTMPDVSGHGSVPLSHSGNVKTILDYNNFRLGMDGRTAHRIAVMDLFP